MRQKTNLKEWNNDGDVYFESREQKLKLEKIFEKVNQGAGVMTGLKSTEKKLKSTGKTEGKGQDPEMADISEWSDSGRETSPKKRPAKGRKQPPKPKYLVSLKKKFTVNAGLVIREENSEDCEVSMSSGRFSNRAPIKGKSQKASKRI